MNRPWLSLIIAALVMPACALGDRAVAKTTEKAGSATEPAPGKQNRLINRSP